MDVPSFYAKDRGAWRAWLADNHDRQQAVWLVFDKGKNRRLSYDDIVEEALCFGWVDSKPGKVSETQSKLYLSKRKPKSAWSKSNKERIERLTKANLMAPQGLVAVKVAKQNGSWEALNQSDSFVMPPELLTQLAANPKAQQFYEALSNSSKRIILEWIYSAKKEETKLVRVNETVELAAKGIKAHHYRQ